MEQKTFYITEEEVEKNLKYDHVIECLGKAFQYLREGKANAPSRVRTLGNGNILNTMPASIDPMGLSGLKYYFANHSKARFIVALFSHIDPGTTYLIEANRLGQVRTGALSALASSMLVRKKEISLGLIGAGYQAESQLLAHASVFKLREVRAYSRTERRAKEFAGKMLEHGIEVLTESRVSDVTANSDIVCTVTPSSDPIIHRSDFGNSYHVNLAGSNLPWRREASPDILAESDLVVVEHLEQAMTESREIKEYVQHGGKPVELKDINAGSGNYPGKTVFKSMGNGIEDVAAGYSLLMAMGLHR